MTEFRTLPIDLKEKFFAAGMPKWCEFQEDAQRWLMQDKKIHILVHRTSDGKYYVDNSAGCHNSYDDALLAGLKAVKL